METLALQPPELGCDDIHLWRVALDSAIPLSLADPEAFLSEDERMRSDRLRVPEVRRRFIVGRSLLRCILSAYLQKAPQELAFNYGPHGKPLEFPWGNERFLHFNLSHSQHWLILGITIDRRIGVDLEWHNPQTDYSQIARRYFSPQEAQWLMDLPVDIQRSVFFTIWSRKEAFLKACGEGFNLPSHSFSLPLFVPSSPTPFPLFFSVTNQNWFLSDLPGPDGFSASVVADRSWESVNYLDFKS